jgi:hypothetical protein
MKMILSSLNLVRKIDVCITSEENGECKLTSEINLFNNLLQSTTYLCYERGSSSPGRSARGGEAPRGRSATGRWNPLGATERREATTVTSWSGQTRGGWTMVPAQGPLVDGGWCEGWLVDYASAGTPRFIAEDDVGFFAKREVVGR